MACHEVHSIETPSSTAIGLIKIEKTTVFPMEKHAWGQFVYSMKGIIELTIKNKCYMAPPEFGIWLPPETEHLAWGDNETTYFLLNIDVRMCKGLPERSSILAVGGITKSILLDLSSRSIEHPETEEDIRLVHVLIDQLRAGGRRETLLPMSKDTLLQRVLEELINNPGDNRSLSQWANYVNTTERTLSRRCQRDLGMSFMQWRQRLRLSRAVVMLSNGLTVQVVARKLGYSTTSSFIAMFQKAMGSTPNTFRNN
ncbi:helix-turn-helix transcriptional regulator [Acinetobacter baumannii]|uniref:AraC family transcriptional regulator n=1 Tax=Acinetobacter baumannii TaxID=470 RepID=UPI0034656882|nr:helix-turn-helix domain-containing protein [Acinetobacter baumannii]